MLSELQIMNKWASVLTEYKSTGERIFEFARAIEAEVRKQDDALILQLVVALEDLAGAGEEAWSEERPCVRIGKKAITAARARLGEKT